MRENPVPTFNECEQVYQVSPALEGIAAAAIVVAALIGFLVLVAAGNMGVGPSAWMVGAVAGLLVLLAFCGLVVFAGDRIGIHTDGVLVRTWPWGRRFIHFGDIIGLEDKSAVTVGKSEPYSRLLTARVRVDRDQSRCVKISGMDEVTEAHAWEHLGAVRDTIVSRCALRDLGDAASTRQRIRRSKRSTIVVLWTVRRWYPPREEPIRLFFNSDTPSTLDECDRIYSIARNGGRTVRRIGLCESGIVIDDTREGTQAYKWADVTGLIAEVEQGRFLWSRYYRSLCLLLGDPSDEPAAARAMLMCVRREPLESELRAFTQLQTYICDTLELSYSDELSSLDIAGLDSGDMEGSVTWVRT